MKSSRVQSFFAGMLVANGAPHLASAVSGREHMTPLAGRRSGAVTNGVWAGLNLAGGVVLLRLARKGKAGNGGIVISSRSRRVIWRSRRGWRCRSGSFR
ncbi:hypothetical protein [Actinomadura algeriensis]|uniref:MFS transporter n=1 Tax=Actinomadura algeriensis TaxID=1679523 RepID=A0ABR9K1W7_9ACTN|nr:hypothetical protein [Actinomadura algeriensis]MBE1536598.1 hypothetical protein [Actinomadura algeriensis]